MQLDEQPPLPTELPTEGAAPAGAPLPEAHEHRVGSAWRLYSREELDQMDMSRLDGIDPELQRQLKWAAIRMMIHAQITLNM